MEPMQFFQMVIEHPLYKAVTSLVAAASVIAAMTPNQTDNLVLKWIRWAVDVTALNVGNAENKKK